jgi:hypothetical protein
LTRKGEKHEKGIEKGAHRTDVTVSDRSVSADGRRILDALAQLTDIVYTVIGSRVDFDNVHERTVFDPSACIAYAAWLFSAGSAVDAFRKDSRSSRLTCTSRSAEKIRMAHRICSKLVFQYFYYMALTQDLVKHLRSVGSV